MASYETSAADVTIAIDDALAAGAISGATAAAIKDIVDQLEASGQTVAVDAATTDITDAAAVTAPVVMMAADTSANVTFGADSPVKAMIVGGAGDSNVVFETSDDVSVQLQGGTGDSVATGAGDDSITFTGGTATINTGEGDDQVILQGGTDGGHATIQGGSGNMVIDIQADLAADGVTASIDAGDGFDAVSLNQGKAGHFFEFMNGVFRLVKNAINAHDDDMAVAAGRADNGGIDMVNVNVVQFTDGDTIKDITILADTQGEAMVGRLYAVALGRQAIDHDGANGTGGTNLNGLDFWIDTFGAGNADADLDHLAKSLVNCQEFNDKYGAMSEQDFANAMFANLNAIAADGATTITQVNGMTAADYATQIANGTLSMQDAAIAIANSAEAVKVMGMDGSQYIIDGYTTGDAQ